ncbi:ankyrin repeat domain-containing protein [Rhodococcus sp. SGAir0479]|uniref:ankyrin repeat domain-containing protein n=1 Tax=Rhodococcus sp. SGAir0479 TaxID=2567884 RepID=UPI0010CCE2CE|nr:ankyrin repeat domain-containing protein [Rhodococcus sp. SGAir0479]QCQ93173.1 ankyrin repeat domain-containing protein [Rhodococcus sp. SGAir0479]
MSEEHPAGPDADVQELAGRLFDMARGGDAPALAQYVDAGVPVNLTNDSGDTLLMLAAYHGHADAVRALIERGADVNRPNDRGQTPLAGAVFKGEDAVVAALVDAGADATAGHPTALDAARMFGREDYLQILGKHPE